MVFINDKNAHFYAEFGGRFFIVFSPKSRIECQIITGNTMHIFNANIRFISANYSQNMSAYYYIDRLHSIANGQDISVKISFINCQYEWLPKTQTIRVIVDNQAYSLSLHGVNRPQAKEHTLVFCANNLDIDYSSFGFVLPTDMQRRMFLSKYFGFFDTLKWQNKQQFYMVFLDKDSLQKRYFLRLLADDNKAISNMFEINYFDYNLQSLTSFCVLTKGNKIKIDLSSLHDGKVVDLKIHKTYLCVLFMETGYKVYLKFGKIIIHAFVGCVLGVCYLFVQLQGACALDILPFSLMFDIGLLTQRTITCLKVPFNPILSAFNETRTLTLLDIIDRLNIQVLLYSHLDCTKLLDHLYLQNLSADTQFRMANLILSKCLVSGQALTSYKAKRFILQPLKHLDCFKKSEVFCYLNKLRKIVNSNYLIRLLERLIPIFETLDYHNFEYVFCYVLGVKIEEHHISLQSPKISFSMVLNYNGQKIVLKSGNKDAVIINGVEYIGKNGIDLVNSSFKNTVLQCSINNLDNA